MWKSRCGSRGAVWKSRWPSWAPIPNKPMVSVDVKQHSADQWKEMDAWFCVPSSTGCYMGIGQKTFPFKKKLFLSINQRPFLFLSINPFSAHNFVFLVQFPYKILKNKQSVSGIAAFENLIPCKSSSKAEIQAECCRGPLWADWNIFVNDTAWGLGKVWLFLFLWFFFRH